jgi:Uncharacterized conserved protein
MKICIVGWYGTETIGDRAIIAGIYSFLIKSFSNIEITLGSLYPFYSERMIYEDRELYKTLFKKELDIKLFNSRDKRELNKNIRDSDMVIVGGGPLMHIDELYMIEYSLKQAKKLSKKTGIIGCGVGPVFPKEFKQSILNIISCSDIVILRDEVSKNNVVNISKELNYKLNNEKIKVSFDPAVECALTYLENGTDTYIQNIDIVINLRDFPSEYSANNRKEEINKKLEDFIISIANEFKERKIKLIPMHYFSIGNDDREFLNKIKIRNNIPNVEVQNKILSLKETMDIFINANLNIGMRFHSVVLQTILNGKNYILDYTEPSKGKISGFLKDIDVKGFFNERYVSLQGSDQVNLNINKDNLERNKFIYDSDEIKKRLRIYEDELKKLQS